MEGEDAFTNLSCGPVCPLKNKQSDLRRYHVISSPPYEMIHAPEKSSKQNGPRLTLGVGYRGVQPDSL